MITTIDTNQKPTLLSVRSIKSKTPLLEQASLTIMVYSDGRSVIRKRILSTDFKKEGHDKIYTKLGKSIFEAFVCFKYDSLIWLSTATTETLHENNIKFTDIMR